MHSTVLTVGQNKGKNRLMIDGAYLPRHGWVGGQPITITYNTRSIEIRPDVKGRRKVVGRKRGSVIDIQNEQLSGVFQVSERVEVRVTSSLIEIRQTPADRARIREQAPRKTSASLFSGAGLLDEASFQAGYEHQWSVEVDEHFAEMHASNHLGDMYRMCVSDAATFPLPQVDLMTMGIPCTPFSQKRRNSNGSAKRTTTRNDDHDLIDMTLWAGALISQINPRNIVLEEVATFLNSEVCGALMRMLTRMGYHIDTKIVAATDFNGLTVRKRAVIIASHKPYTWPDPIPKTSTLASVLLPENDPACEWFTRGQTHGWLLDYWDKQTARGNNFAAQQLTPQTEAVQAITAGYYKPQGDSPVVKHSTLPDTYRFLTIDEIKQIMGLPAPFGLGPSKSRALRALGQGVVVEPFRRIIENLA